MKKMLCFALCLLLPLLSACGTVSLDGTTAQTDLTTTPSGTQTTGTTKPEPKRPFLETPAVGPYEASDWRSHPQDYKLIALTFDDAPAYSDTNANITTHIIQVLNQYEGHGTLFVAGYAVEKHGFALLQYAVEHGFELGNHTYHHYNMVKKNMSQTEIEKELTDLNILLQEKMQYELKYCRAGELAVNQTVFAATTAVGMPVIGEVISTRDYSSDYDADFVKRTVLENAFDGAIFLMHTWSGSTNQAIEGLVKALYEDGYRFVTLSELFAFNGIREIPTDKHIYGATDHGVLAK